MTGLSRRLVLLRLLVFAFLAAALFSKISDPDIWFDLVLGRQIVTTATIPTSEFYLYSLLGQPTTWPEWGFGLLYYVVYKGLGYWGMSVLNALLAGGAMFFCYRAAEIGRRSGPVALALLAGLLWVVSFRAVYRPETILYLCLGCGIYFLERYLRDPNTRWLTPLPLVGIALANFHPSVFILLLLIGAYGVQVAWDSFHSNGTNGMGRAVTPIAVTLLATAAASLLNPYGSQQIGLPFAYAQSTELLSRVAEYRATMDTNFRWPLLAIAALALWALRERPRRPVDWLLTIFFGYLAFRYVRNVAMFALMTYVPVSRAAEARLGRWGDAPGRTIARRLVSVVSVLVVSVTLLRFLSDRRWGAGPDEASIPDKAAAAIREGHLPGRIFNYYETGGYLAWTLYDDYLPFIDGRRYTNDAAFATHDAVFVRADPAWKEILDRYEVNIVVTRAITSVSGQMVPTVAFLTGDQEWGLVSAEPWYYLFVRKRALGERRDISMLDKDDVWRGVIEESKAVIAAYPGGSAPAWLSGGMANFKLGRTQLAYGQFAQYSKLRPDDREAADLVADLGAALKGDSGARGRMEALYQSGRDRLAAPLVW